jgi:hypothetical protein
VPIDPAGDSPQDYCEQDAGKGQQQQMQLEPEKEKSKDCEAGPFQQPRGAALFMVKQQEPPPGC